MKNLLLAAFKPEIESIDKVFGGKPGFICDCVGIGIAEAAVGTTELIIKHKPERIIFLGTCGALSKKYPLLSVATATKVCLADNLSLNDYSYFPEIYQQSFSAAEDFLSGSEIIKDNFFSPLSITKDLTAVESNYKKLGEFENLELFGIAQACSKFSVKWNNLSVVTNYLGTDAHREWLQNQPIAAELTLKRLQQIFS